MELLCLTFGMLSLDGTGSKHMLGTRYQFLLPVLDHLPSRWGPPLFSVRGGVNIIDYYRTHTLPTGPFSEQIDTFRQCWTVTYSDLRRPKSFQHGRKWVNTKEKGSTMNFRVKLKNGPSVTVDAEKFGVEAEVYFFTAASGGVVASFPVSNVLSIVKEDQPEGDKTGK